MSKKRLPPTNFASLKQHFSEIIREIEEGWHAGTEVGIWPEVKKTIHFVDGTTMTVFEYIDRTSNTVRTYQYGWEYSKDHFWKWHNEPHKSPRHITRTEPHHMHHLAPTITRTARFANWRHHDLYCILETMLILHTVRPS